MENMTGDYYFDVINSLTDDMKIKCIFSELPSSSIDVFKKTIVYKANKEYATSSSQLPNNFFALIESSLKSSGFLRTYKVYSNEFNKIQDFLE